MQLKATLPKLFILFVCVSIILIDNFFLNVCCKFLLYKSVDWYTKKAKKSNLLSFTFCAPIYSYLTNGRSQASSSF